MNPDAIIFKVREDEGDGGCLARALGPSIVTQAQLAGIAAAGLLGLFVPQPLLAAQAGDRFAIETHDVGTVLREDPLRVSFKLDTVTGNVWRFTGTEFLPVDVPVGGVPGYATWSTKRSG